MGVTGVRVDAQTMGELEPATGNEGDGESSWAGGGDNEGEQELDNEALVSQSVGVDIKVGEGRGTWKGWSVFKDFPYFRDGGDKGCCWQGGQGL
jgi:hypothetical protein